MARPENMNSHGSDVFLVLLSLERSVRITMNIHKNMPTVNAIWNSLGKSRYSHC